MNSEATKANAANDMASTALQPPVLLEGSVEGKVIGITCDAKKRVGVMRRGKQFVAHPGTAPVTDRHILPVNPALP
jgi:hypothetical protein